MSKHTPGPWRIGRKRLNDGGDTVDIVSQGGHLICTVEEPWHPAGIDAQASLIAVSPEMPAELKRLRDHCADLLQLIDGGVNLDLDLKRTDALIAKAKGGKDD